MGWIISLTLAATVALAMTLLGRLPRATWELVAATLLIGIAGYAWQGHPDLNGAPRSAETQVTPFDENLATLRRGLGEHYGNAAMWLTVSDGLGRQGKTQDAANILISALRANPNNADLWVGMGNALVAHGGGIVSPSAEYAYRQASIASPDAISPPFFYGLALARSGQLQRARDIWSALLPKVPVKSDLHGQLERDIAMIDNALSGQGAKREGAGQ
ncbi:MAG: cytochrome C biosynthesis protein [Sphingobium sp.]